MRDYGKVHSTFWSSPTTATMSDHAKVLCLYLMTCNHSTIAGVFRMPDGYVAEDLQWSAETVQKGFAELAEKGFAMRCETTKWVWVVKHLEWNPPENPNQIKAAIKVASGVPSECSWKPAFMRVGGELLGMKQEAPAEPLPNPSQTVPQPVTVSVSVAVSGTEAVAGEEAVVPAAPAPPTFDVPEKLPSKKARTKAPELERPEDIDPQIWTDWVALRLKKDATVTLTVVSAARAEAQKAGMTIGEFFTVWCLRGSQGMQADWLKPHERGNGVLQPLNKQEALEARNRRIAEEWANESNKGVIDAAA